jgi:autotransporter-associated beta strand protein
MKKIAALLSLAMLVGEVSSQAQTSTNLFYDANGITSGIGGTGNWTTTGALWTTSAAGTATTISGGWTNSAAWTNSNANNALLQGTFGTVSLSSGTIYANQIQANTTGFTIQNSSTATTSANRYFRTKNGFILADGVNLNISSGITTNGAITGLEGVITNAVGAANTSVTITGTTLNADSSVRIGFDGSNTDVWVPLIIGTTGNGFASLKNVGGTNSIYGTVTVNAGSKLTFGASSSTRRINVRGNLTTVNTDLTIGESGDVGMVALYGSNSFGGDVLLKFGQLGYGTNTAFGNSTVVISDGTTFGQQGGIGTTEADRTLANKVSLQGNVTLGTGSYGNYFSGSWDLNGGSRAFTIANTSYFSGSVTNGSVNVTNSSATRELRLSGNNSLTALTWTQGIVALDSSKSNDIGALTMNGQTTTYPSLYVLNPATNRSISTRGALVFSGTNNSVIFSNNALPSGTYTLLEGTSLDTNILSQGGLTFKVVVTTTGTNTATNTFALNGSPVSWQRYTYAFSNTPTALVATLAVAAPDIGWNGGIGNWNTDPSNQVWILDGIPTAFNSNDNVNIGTEGTLNVDSAGVTAGIITISGASNSVIQGGALTASSVTKTGTGTNTFNSVATLSQGGITVGDGVMIVAGPLSYTNDTVINGGTLQTSGNERIPNESFVRINTTGATFQLGGNETVRGLEGVSNSIVNLPADTTLTMGSAGISVASTNYFNVTGAGSLVKTGTNQVSFRGNNILNSFTVLSGRADLRGVNTINTINVASGGLLGYGVTNRAMGDAVVNLAGGSSIGQISAMGTTDADRMMANQLNVQGDVNLGSGAYGCYFSGNVNLSGGSRTLTLVNSTYFLGSVTNGELLLDISSTSTNSKTLYLSGAANNLSIGVTLKPTSTGFPLILSLGNSNALGGGKLTVDGNATLAVTNSFVLTNEFSLNSGTTLTLDTGANTWTNTGRIGGPLGSIIKSGSGTLNLNGSLNYIDGTTTVADGKLVVPGTGFSGSLEVTPNSVDVKFLATPSLGTYMLLPGPLGGNYSSNQITFTGLATDQAASFIQGSGSQPASVTITNKASQTITGLASADTKTFGDPTYTLNVGPGESTSPLTFSSDNTSVATVSSAGLVTIEGAGSTTIRVNQAADANYLAASEVTQVLTVAKATPSITVAPTASAVTVGAQLSTSNLSGGTASVGTTSVSGTYTWTTPSTVVSSSGSYFVTFNPTDSANYNTASTSASVTANPAGTTYSGWLSGNGGTASDAAFLDYVFGAATPGILDPSLKPAVAVSSENLVLTYYVRQGTFGLTVVPELSLDLSSANGGFAPLDQTQIQTYETSDFGGVSVQRRTATVPVSGAKKFLRVKAEQAP